MKFSDRIGITKPKTFLQINGMDDDLKICLWNAFQKHISFLEEELYEEIIGDFFKKAIVKSSWDSLDPFLDPSVNDRKMQEIKDLFSKLEWFDIYNFIEFIPNTEYSKSSTSYIKKQDFLSQCNKCFERELSGYRFIKSRLVPITNEQEIKSVEEAFLTSESDKKLKGIRIHLSTALAALSDRKAPSYRNSIKESISAVETACRVLTGESTLGDALKRLASNNIHINNEVKSGFIKLYAYTNSKDSGIRHAIINEVKEPDFEDAKYMLVSCSAFINYVIGKSAIKTYKTI